MGPSTPRSMRVSLTLSATYHSEVRPAPPLPDVQKHNTYDVRLRYCRSDKGQGTSLPFQTPPGAEPASSDHARWSRSLWGCCRPPEDAMAPLPVALLSAERRKNGGRGRPSKTGLVTKILRSGISGSCIPTINSTTCVEPPYAPCLLFRRRTRIPASSTNHG